MEALLDTLKWSAVIGALTLVLVPLRPFFERRYSARWRYWAWLALAVLALLAPVQWEKLTPSTPAVTAPVVIDVPAMSLHVSRETGVTLQPAAAPSYTPAEGRTVTLGEVLPVVWLGGAAVFALYHVLATLLFRHKAQRWSRDASEATLDIYDAVCQDMGLSGAPKLRVSSAVGSPVLLGLFRPCLLLPGEQWAGWELAFILRHELTHYRRHDLWYKLVLLAANALHWFNPLLYLLVKEAGADLEMTCDDAVMAGADRETRRAYSETLLSAIHREKGVAMSTHFYGSKEIMKERFRNILTKRRRKWGVLVLAVTLLVTLASACAFGLRQAEAEQPEDSPETPPVFNLGNTESFTYDGLELTVTNVREIRQESQRTDMEEDFPYTVYVCGPDAQASVIKPDMDDGTYANWAFDLASGEHIDITSDTGPMDITADTLGVYNKEASLYVLRFEMYDENQAEPVLPEPEIAEPAADVSVLDMYRPVLRGDAVFHGVSGTFQQDLTIDNIKQTITDEESLSVSIPYFAVVDLDSDGETEVVLWLRVNDVNDVGFEVLHRIGDEIYGYLLYYREFNDLKTDGTFTWSGGAANNGVGILTFSETGYTMHEADALGNTNVTWYDFTPENIELILGGI